MENLLTMLTKTEDKPQTTAPKQINAVDEILTSVKIQFELDEYIRDFQYNTAFESGNFKFSYKDALNMIISEHKANHEEIMPRPHSFRKTEKRGRR